ncbi:MAG: HNH endonuclease [Anaerolineales bacterium]|nr:MAG: HNH endonuclease [Anaerolineales bacterium]
MSEDIPVALRRLVFERAGGRCEYCLLPQAAVVYHHEPDHIIPRQHGGRTEADNLALACTRCNRNKGPNIGSFDPQTSDLVPFYNPRTQVWKDHFQLDGPVIRPLTPQGRVTVKILRLNDPARVEEREQLIVVGLYP